MTSDDVATVDATLAGAEVFVEPVEAEIHVRVLPGRPDAPGAVSMSLRGEGANVRTLLDEREARALVDVLASAADDVQEHRPDE